MEYNRCTQAESLLNAAHETENASVDEKKHDDNLINNDQLWK